MRRGGKGKRDRPGLSATRIRDGVTAEGPRGREQRLPRASSRPHRPGRRREESSPVRCGTGSSMMRRRREGSPSAVRIHPSPRGWGRRPCRTGKIEATKRWKAAKEARQRSVQEGTARMPSAGLAGRLVHMGGLVPGGPAHDEQLADHGGQGHEHAGDHGSHGVVASDHGHERVG